MDNRGQSIQIGLLIIALLVGAIMIGVTDLAIGKLDNVSDEHVTNSTAQTGLGYTESVAANLPIIYVGIGSIGLLLFAIFVSGGVG